MHSLIKRGCTRPQTKSLADCIMVVCTLMRLVTMCIDCYNEMYYTLSIPGCGLYRGSIFGKGGATNIKYLSLAFISKFCTLASYKITIYPLFLILL